MAVATATMMSVVHFVILAIFLSLMDLMIQFIGLIDRVLSPCAVLTKDFISCQLFQPWRLCHKAMVGRG
jgi:hypothetical protein